MSRVRGMTGRDSPPAPSSCTANPNMPSTITAVIATSDHFVLQALNSQAQITMVGAAISVDLAMRALEAPTLRPSATSAVGSHSSRPKLTRPQAMAASVRAVVMPRNPWLTGGTGA